MAVPFHIIVYSEQLVAIIAINLLYAIAVAPSPILVVEGEMELAVGQRAIAFYIIIVAYPVGAADITDGCKEVGYFVDIDELFELFVGILR